MAGGGGMGQVPGDVTAATGNAPCASTQADLPVGESSTNNQQNAEVLKSALTNALKCQQAS